MRDIAITSSALILVILGIRYLAKGKISPILQYALWLPVVFRLILPLPLWSSQLSILNYIPSAWTEDADSFFSQAGVDVGAFLSESVNADNKVRTDTELAAVQSDNVPLAKALSEIDRAESELGTQSDGIFDAGKRGVISIAGVVSRILPLIWITGILFVGGYMLFYQIKWKKYLKANRKPLRKAVGNKEYLNKLSVYTVEGLPSPCLSGNCIYLTKKMASDEKKLAHILAHEYCHYKHLDSVWVIVRCVLCAVYWFHPLVWTAAYVSKQDSELACDAAAIRLLGEKERISYGKTLLQLVVSGDTYDKKRVGIASTMSGGEKGIRERIFLVAGKRKYLAVVSLIVVAFVAGFIAITFSGTVKKNENERGTDVSSIDNEQILSDFDEMQDNLQKPEKEHEASQKAIEDAEIQVAVLAKLDSYDAYIAEVGSGEGVYGYTNAKIPSDYVQDYFNIGPDTLEEGMYLLETRKGSDGSDIKIYGMYTKEFGCEGITILIADDSNKFDIPWIFGVGYGGDENLRLYESAEDGMPRTFAFKMLWESSNESEIYNCYICDRYDTGTITVSRFLAEDYLAQMKDRIRFEVAPSENSINVYDNDTLIGSVDVPDSAKPLGKIEDVILDGRIVSWNLGQKEAELKLIIAIGLKYKHDTGMETVWYHDVTPLSFSVECGDFGEREFTLGKAEIAKDYTIRTNVGKESATLDEITDLSSRYPDLIPFNSDTHYDVEITYMNPCPSAGRISDGFGERIHPVTGMVLEHNGIDFAAEQGTDILAAAEGSVYKTGYDSELGNYVVLYHVLSGEFTYYACCSEILVSEGEEVAAGQKIAAVGSTGRSSGPHLHFALSRNGEYVEPEFE